MSFRFVLLWFVLFGCVLFRFVSFRCVLFFVIAESNLVTDPAWRWGAGQHLLNFRWGCAGHPNHTCIPDQVVSPGLRLLRKDVLSGKQKIF